MPPLTLFLARFLGLYCIVIALGMLTHRRATLDGINALLRDPGGMLLLEVFGIAAGLAMVVGHTIWSGGALPMIVTLFGWATLLKCAGLMAMSPNAKLRYFAFLRYEAMFPVYMGITLALGVYLTVAGFRAG